MAAGDSIWIYFFWSDAVLQPTRDLAVLLIVQIQSLDEPTNEVTLLLSYLEIGPSESTHEFEQKDTLVPGQFFQHSREQVTTDWEATVRHFEFGYSAGASVAPAFVGATDRLLVAMNRWPGGERTQHSPVALDRGRAGERRVAGSEGGGAPALEVVGRSAQRVSLLAMGEDNRPSLVLDR